MKQKTHILRLLTPSWVSNIIGIVAAVLLTTGVIVLSRYQGSQLRQQIFDVKSSQTASSNGTMQSIATNLANNSVLGSLPLLLAWAGVGLVIYYFAISIVQGFGQAAQLREQLKYVNSSRPGLFRQAVTNLGVRLLAVVGWFIFIKVTLGLLLPYALAAANIASGSVLLTAAGYAALTALVIYVTVQGHAVFLRLIALKPRVFS